MTLVKPYYEITIKDYSTMERTGNINQFATSIVPWFMIKNKIKSELKKVSKELNSSSSEENKDDLVWETMTIAKINGIEACYLGIINLLDLNMKINVLSGFMSRRNRRKIKTDDKNLRYYISKIEEYTGIKIETIKDVAKVRKNLEFRKDKYNENYSKKPQTQSEKMYLMAVALGVFSYLNQPIDVNMSIVDFAVLREEAVKRIEKERAKNKK